MRRLKQILLLLFFPALVFGQQSFRPDSAYRTYYLQLHTGDSVVAVTTFLQLNKNSGKDSISLFYYKLSLAENYFVHSDKENAFNQYLEVIGLAERFHRDSLLFMAYYRMGKMYMEFNDINSSLRYLNKALLLIKSVNNQEDVLKIYREVSLVNSYLDNHAASVEYLLKMVPICMQLKNQRYLSNVYNNLGINYGELKDSAKAFSTLWKCLTIRLLIRDSVGVAQVHNNLGTLYYEFGQYGMALKYYMKGLELRKRSGSPGTSIIESSINIGKSYLKLNQLNKALVYLEKSRLDALGCGHIELERRADEQLYLLYSLKGDYKKAFELLERYHIIKDSLYGLDKKEEFNRISIQHLFDKKLRQDSLNHIEAILKKQKELAVSDEREKSQSLLRNIFLVAFILMLGVAFLLLKQVKRIRSANKMIERQKAEIEKKQEEVMDSIYYARRIQQSLLTSDRNIEKILSKLKGK